MRTHAANLVKKPDNTLTVMSRHNEMQCQHAGTIQDVGSPHIMRPIALPPLAHHRLVIRRLEPTLDTILTDQENIVTGIRIAATVKRERFHPVRQFDQFRQVVTQR